MINKTKWQTSAHTILCLKMILTLLISGCAGKSMNIKAPNHDKSFVIYSKEGKQSKIDHIVEEAILADVIFIGETHNNPIANELEKILLKAIHQKTIDPANKPNKKNVVLSLEFFETDVQTIVDEYMQGLITEEHFIVSSRAWHNYRKAYHPLIEYAKDNSIPVVAANAPRRYVNMVSRLGRQSLNDLSDSAKSWLPPLPYGEASEIYIRKINELNNNLDTKIKKPDKNHGKNTNLPPEKAKKIMAAMKKTSHEIIHNAQSLWDASMAWSISKTLQHKPDSLVISINGNFHSEGGLGIPEHLSAYSPGLKTVIITIKPEKSPTGQKISLSEKDDFIIFTTLPD
jgi:uncharacterized iron-regulated protein